MLSFSYIYSITGKGSTEQFTNRMQYSCLNNPNRVYHFHYFKCEETEVWTLKIIHLKSQISEC